MVENLTNFHQRFPGLPTQISTFLCLQCPLLALSGRVYWSEGPLRAKRGSSQFPQQSIEALLTLAYL